MPGESASTSLINTLLTTGVPPGVTVRTVVGVRVGEGVNEVGEGIRVGKGLPQLFGSLGLGETKASVLLMRAPPLPLGQRAIATASALRAPFSFICN